MTDETVMPTGCNHVWVDDILYTFYQKCKLCGCVRHWDIETKLWYYSPAWTDEGDMLKVLAEKCDYWMGGYAW